MNEQLLTACKEGNVEQATKLLEEGADAAFVKRENGTWGANDVTSSILVALNLQDAEKRFSLIRLLLDNKADVTCKEEHYDWRGCGSSISALEKALRIAKEDTSILKLFLEHNADPNQVSTSSIHSMRTDGEITTTLLTDAAKAMQIPIIQCLLEAGADANVPAKRKTTNEYGWCSDTIEYPLHICAKHTDETKAIEAIKILLDHSADINMTHRYLHQEQKPTTSNISDPRDCKYESGITTNKVEETALCMAIEAKNSVVVKFLVDSGADMTIPRKFGNETQTPEEFLNFLYSGDDEVESKMKFAIGKNPLTKSAMK